MVVNTLGDGSKIINLLDDRSIIELKNIFVGKDVVAFRVHGLIGDIIKATTILSPFIKNNPDKKYVYMISYNDLSKYTIVKDLFTDLVSKGLVVGLFLNEYDVVGNMNFYQYQFFRELGCSTTIDLYYHSSEAYQHLSKGSAYLGFDNLPTNINKVSLFRFSGFHNHVPLRHIPEQDWLKLEEHLLGLGLEVHLYGYDDMMQTTQGVIDHRKKLSVLETIKNASDSALCISTTTFLPLYMHHWSPCLVYIDPVDTVATNLLWRSNHNYLTINTQLSDYLSYVKNYVSMWYLSNKGIKGMLEQVAKEIVGDIKGR